MSTVKKDDLEAVRTIVDALTPFSREEQERIFRWSSEKLGIISPLPTGQTPPPGGGHTQPPPPPPAPPHLSGTADIKTFMQQKKPKNDVQFAAAVAYFYRFEAPPSERKEVINKDDLQEAARKTNHERFANPHKTLSNAHQLGLLDKGGEKATFVINSVGENLVAMTLPDGATSPKPKKPTPRTKVAKAVKSKATKKTTGRA